jgi:hypothetical protein
MAMNYLTKYVLTAALAVTGTVATAAASSAMPMAPLAAPALVEHAAWGCGPGWHPNPWGRCVPNRVVVYPRYIYRHGPAFYAWHRHHVWHRRHHW